MDISIENKKICYFDRKKQKMFAFCETKPWQVNILIENRRNFDRKIRERQYFDRNNKRSGHFKI